MGQEGGGWLASCNQAGQTRLGDLFWPFPPGSPAHHLLSPQTDCLHARPGDWRRETVLNWRTVRLAQLPNCPVPSLSTPMPHRTQDLTWRRQVPAGGGQRDGLVMPSARAQQPSSWAIVCPRLKQPTQAQTQSQTRPADTQPTPTQTQLKAQGRSSHPTFQIQAQVQGCLGRP